MARLAAGGRRRSLEEIPDVHHHIVRVGIAILTGPDAALSLKDVRGRAGRDKTIIKLQIDLRADRPDQTGNQLIGESVLAFALVFERVVEARVNVSGAQARAHGEGQLGRV